MTPVSDESTFSATRTREVERVTDQVDRLVAHILLNAIDRDDDPSVFLHLLEPLLVILHLTTGPQECTVGIKQIQNLSPRNRDFQCC